jgi:hypothetical protein
MRHFIMLEIHHNILPYCPKINTFKSKVRVRVRG